CARQQANLRKEETTIDATIRREAKAIEAIRRLKTIPAVGEWVAVAIYAQVGDHQPISERASADVVRGSRALGAPERTDATDGRHHETRVAVAPARSGASRPRALV